MDKFIVYVEEIESLKELSNEEIGIFFRAVTEYVKSGIAPNLPERLIFPFRFITAHISRDQKKYKDISEKRKIAGKKGLDSRMKNSESGLSEENEKYAVNVEQCIEDTKQHVGDTKQCVGDTEQGVRNTKQCVVYTEQHSGETEKCVENVERRIESTERCVEETKKDVEGEEQHVGDTEQYENAEENAVYFQGYEAEINNNNSNEELKKSVENEFLSEESFKEDNAGDKEEIFNKDNGKNIGESFQKNGGRNIKECFEEFWNAYPNKTGRNGAAIEYMCMFTGKKSHFEIMNVLNDFKKSDEWKKGDGTNVPPPQKWLSDLKKFGDKHFIFSSS
ncbi:MAG: hypothetical protein J6V36_01860 [Clostridia bacterium]|nr:hypothetical protein [Clostridia bacterium]